MYQEHAYGDFRETVFNVWPGPGPSTSSWGGNFIDYEANSCQSKKNSVRFLTVNWAGIHAATTGSRSQDAWREELDQRYCSSAE